jgi:hypothetical protein
MLIEINGVKLLKAIEEKSKTSENNTLVTYCRRILEVIEKKYPEI